VIDADGRVDPDLFVFGVLSNAEAAISRKILGSDGWSREGKSCQNDRQELYCDA
jgi:hypothetical protein